MKGSGKKWKGLPGSGHGGVWRLRMCQMREPALCLASVVVTQRAAPQVRKY